LLAPGALAQHLQGCAGALTQIVDRIDEPLLAACPDLRAVANIAVGYNNIDVAACTRRGIVVTNTPGVLDDTTADLAFALLMATARRITEAEAWLRAGHWKAWAFDLFLGQDVHHASVGIVGFGRIGQAVARRAVGFGMRILYAAPRAVSGVDWAHHVRLDALLAESDFVSLHCPLTPQTENLLSRERIALLKPGAVVVNTARGAVVDDAALADALGSGRVAAAGLDVFRDEPRVPAAYLGLENVVLTPHIGSGTRETRAAMTRLVLEDVLRVARGEPPRHPVS